MSRIRVALRASTQYAPTLKEIPVEAEIASHRLMLRAGMIRKTASGIYSFLPLGYRSVRKVEQIVREEMDAIGCQELLLPIVQPAELWRQSGRWEEYGPELARFTDRAGREFCLGPTHEELVTALVRNEVRSYRDLPLSLYQINTKFRDEIRPRFGLLRGREFVMKDAYSFHESQESLQDHYNEQAAAYARICNRLALTWLPVKAESGQIGGKVTTEFMALAESGEAKLVYCECGWAANVDAAETIIQPVSADTVPREMTKVHTPQLRTIAQLSETFGISEHDLVKTMAGKTAAGRLVFFCVPGDRELNPVKARWAVDGVELLAEEDFQFFGIPKGSLGPVSPPEGTVVVADRSLRENVAWGIGANEEDFHFFSAMPGRDFEVDLWADLTVAQPGDRCPECEGLLQGAHGIEVAQIFQLGTKYAESMGATFTAKDGSEKPFVMGCYGVGITRSLAAVVEQHNDGNGIVWPMSVAPLHVAVVPLSVGDDDVWPIAESIWNAVADAGVETIIDDRDERAGVKFADTDLIGYPIQIVVGKKGVEKGVVEVKARATGSRQEIAIDQVVRQVVTMVENELARLEGRHS